MLLDFKIFSELDVTEFDTYFFQKHVTFEVELNNPVITSKLGAIGSNVTLQLVDTAAREKDAPDKLRWAYYITLSFIQWIFWIGS